MTYIAQVIKVLIASPSDVSEERKLIPEIIYRWNANYSESKKIVFTYYVGISRFTSLQWV